MLAGVCALSIVFMYKYSTPAGQHLFVMRPMRPMPLRLTLLLPYRGITRIGERTRLARTQTGQVVFISTEILRGRLDLVRAELVVDDTPDELVGLHGGGAMGEFAGL
jgi:hypothetical protein